MRSAAARSLSLAAVLAWRTLVAAPATADEADLDGAYASAGFFGPAEGRMWAAASLPSGDVAVVGVVFSIDDPHVDWELLHSSGSSADCGAPIPSLASFGGRAVLTDHLGNLLVGGVATLDGTEAHQRALLARFTAADRCHTLDPSWSGSGFRLLDEHSFCDHEDCAVVDIAEALTPGPRLFVLVESEVGRIARYFVVAFQPSGAINTTFGNKGFAEATASGLGTLVPHTGHLAIDPQGRPVVLATRNDPDTALDLDPVLVRLTTAGDLDTSFPNGTLVSGYDDPDRDHEGVALLIEPNGAIVFALNCSDGIARVTQFVPPYGLVDSQPVAQSTIAALVRQGDDKILVVYASNGGAYLGIERLTRSMTDSSLTFDMTFGGQGGGFYYPNIVADSIVPVDMVLSAGRPFVIGNVEFNTGAQSLFAFRTQSRYLFADGLEYGTPALWSAAH